MTRLGREVQTLEIADRVQTGELDFKQGDVSRCFSSSNALVYPRLCNRGKHRKSDACGSLVWALALRTVD